jgi:hypothetical protein
MLIVCKLDLSITKYFDSLKEIPKRKLSLRAKRFWIFQRSVTNSIFKGDSE